MTEERRSEKRAPRGSVRSLLELIRLCYWAWSAGDARGPKGNRLALRLPQSFIM